jgi:glycosyltransferase involved in cell wall biosynthesis
MKNYNVLIDGLNLRLKYGSGIKYYTLSLIKALEKDVSISLLFDFKISSKMQELIKVEFLEKLYNGNINRNKKELLKSLIKKICNLNNEKIFELNEIPPDKELSYLKNKTIINYDDLFFYTELAARKNTSIKLNLNKKIDIFHATYMLNLQINKAKKITTVHDLIPLKLPYTTLDNKKIFYNKILNSLKTSSKIITVSEYSRKDLLKTFDLPEDKVVNCYQPYYLPEELIKYNFKVKKFGLVKNEYFLFVGNIEPKKNIGRVIQAFLNIDTDKKLVIVGKKAWLWEELLKGSEKYLNKKIIMLDYLNREDLIALYQNALAFVFPSFSEGFGLPPLEAMACGCPVVTSNITSLPEVCADAAIYCDPYSVISIQNAMEKVMNMTESERKLLIKKGYERVKFFNVNDYKNKVLKVYESIL